jgi:ribosomal protein L11 methyltransferase
MPLWDNSRCVDITGQGVNAVRWQELSVATSQDAAESVANLFYEVGATGVVIQDPQDIARYLSEAAWDAYEISPDVLEAEHVVVKAYLPLSSSLDNRISFLQMQLAALEEHFPGFLAELSLSEISEEDWAQAWKNFYLPEKVGEKIVIVPAWQKYRPQEGELAIWLDPGMAFGTGNHPTTVMCLHFLEKYLVPGAKVIDVGTGSGILALAAARLGAGQVTGIDIDPLAVTIATENVVVNHLEDRVKIKEADLLAGVFWDTSLIVANIVADAILLLIPQAHQCLLSGGYFIVSGIIRHRLAEVQSALLSEGFAIIEVEIESEWIAMVCQKE